MDHGVAGIAEEESASFLNRPLKSIQGGGGMKPLELEDKDSMLPPEGRAPGLRHRKSVHDDEQLRAGGNGPTSFIQGLVQGVLRQNIGSQFTVRNMGLLCSIAVVLLLALLILNGQTDGDYDGVRTAAPHTNSFGGKNNPGVEHHHSHDGVVAGSHFQRPPLITEEDLPKSKKTTVVES